MIANNIQTASVLESNNILNVTSKNTNKEDINSFDELLVNASKDVDETNLVDTEKNSINKAEESILNNTSIAPVEAANILLASLAGTIINESKEGTVKNENLINKLIAEFSLDKTKVENALKNNLINEKIVLNNPKEFIEKFLSELGLKDENLNKAYKLMFEIISKAIQKDTIKNSPKNYNSEEILLYKDYQSKNSNEYKDVIVNSKNENSIKDFKTLNEEKINNRNSQIVINKQKEEPKEYRKISDSNRQDKIEAGSLNKNSKSDSSEFMEDGEQKKGSNTDINFSQNINKIEAKSVNSININEKLDAKILNDTVVQNVKILSDKNGGSFEIDLKTMNLGKLNLNIETDVNNKVSINLVCNSVETKKLIESNLSELKNSLSNLNIKTDSINVVLNKNLNMEFENNKKEELAYQQTKNDNFRDSNNRRNNKEERKDN